MFSVFFLLNYQSYKYPSTFSRDCAQGVNGADWDGYFYYSKGNNFDDPHQIDATFCADYNNDWLRFKGYSDKTHWGVSTNGGGRSGGCNTDGDWGCCSVNDVVQDFSAHRCYPFWSKLEANCYNEQDDIEVLYKDSAVTSHAYKCSGYDNCKGFYYGDKCQNSVTQYDENNNCKVSLGREGNGNCIWTNCKQMQDYCLSRHYPSKGAKYYFREGQTGDWTEKETLTTIHLTKSDDFYYNQYNISGRIILPDKTHDYYFQLVSKTPATLKIGSTTVGSSDFLHCNPTDSKSHVLYVQAPNTVGPINYEIIIDSGCSINVVDTELKWSSSNSGFSSIDSKYVVL